MKIDLGDDFEKNILDIFEKRTDAMLEKFLQENHDVIIEHVVASIVEVIEYERLQNQKILTDLVD